MTEIGEPVAPPEVDTDETSCPFDHDNPKPPDVENDFIGKGSTLASRMKGAKGTILYEPLVEKLDRVKNPKDDATHAFARGKLPVKITDGSFTHTYPVSCAAHHCIPAQESLKESPLLTFMVKKGDSEPVKGGGYSHGIVWADVGYDVNGSQNGIYLPGSYAVGGGKGGRGVWDSNEDGDEDRPEDAVDEVPDPASDKLTGDLKEGIAATNRKWRYVRQAMKKCPGQFHDRHIDYSLFVQGVLRKIFDNYKALLREKIRESKCGKCKERAQAFKELGFPTPHAMSLRLNGVSNHMKGLLNGSTWKINVFTSKWGLAYMQAVKSNNPAAHIEE